MEDNFSSFFKKSNNGATFNSGPKATKNTRTHHQSTSRITKMDHRKSGKMNLVAANTNQKIKHPLISQFANSGKTVMPNLKWSMVRPIFQAYKIKHDFEEDKPYTKSIGGIKCKLTGCKIYIKYFPENQTWTLFKK